MQLEQKNDAFIVRNKYYSGWEKWILLMSDEHFDSKKCDRKLLKRHHDEAKERNALIFKFGDTFDCMGGKYDKRTHKGDIRPEYQEANYFDRLKEDAAEFYGPYAENIALITPGNHELSVLMRHEIDLVGSLAKSLNCSVGKYSGFIRFQFETKAGANKKSFTLYYTHGSGGGAPVTKGVIQNNRRQHTVDADFYVSGHIHTGTLQPRPKVYLSEQGVVNFREPEHIILGAYKNEFLAGQWADTKGLDPAVLGGMWLRFYNTNGQINGLKYDLIRAK
jgi:predicted phosphodiesterase